MYDGNALRSERLRRGWTLEQAAEALGLSVNHVSCHELARTEQGARYKIPKTSTVRAYARVYGWTEQRVRDILTGTEADTCSTR